METSPRQFETLEHIICDMGYHVYSFAHYEPKFPVLTLLGEEDFLPMMVLTDVRAESGYIRCHVVLYRQHPIGTEGEYVYLHQKYRIVLNDSHGNRVRIIESIFHPEWSSRIVGNYIHDYGKQLGG